MARVKLCGITTASDRDAAVAAGADALGFISEVSVDTHRELLPEDAAALVASTPPFVTTTLVTMPDSPAAGADLVARVRPDVVQVHGLSPADIETLAAAVDARVVAAVGADEPDVVAYADGADALLVDTPATDGGGGTGETHDWARTRSVVEDLDTPVVLAGGLTPANVGEAVASVDPYAVDVASGVEGPDGRKDDAAMRAFVAGARGAV
ncbi:phosphoribosylanthranilate isomerase [Halomarina ordinaria]|uniref:N-(5'-phosphoribosyl)anthranilate isomerase n=1 Tax=Halomarina ordinaria TaxID=3033939 RepID=A0ABD5UE48_9EURY|nr:phosphoribosylanthranilate isomerase [Halomarina sp. PSRA2]